MFGFGGHILTQARACGRMNERTRPAGPPHDLKPRAITRVMDAGRAYQVLELESGAAPDLVKAAYRRLALESHPDRDGGSEARFKEVTEAYNSLKDGAPKSAPAGRAKSRQEKSPRRKGPVPEEDWGRFTRQFEEDEGWWKEYEKKFWQEYERAARGGPGGDEKAREPKKQPDLAVRVDESLCIGCCSCEIIAPGVFEIDKNKNLNPKSRVTDPRGAGVNKIMNAAETCPTKAISVTDTASSERLFPH